MQFHGLFIGIDRFADVTIPELRCAVRDAHALHALFADTLGGTAALMLADEDATRAAIIEHFESRLTQTGEDDFVVITFSGHGSDDHFLVTHDADPDDLGATAIHLDELVRLFARVPAKRLLLVLDCCFSGGAGARVFRHGPTTRALRTVDDALAAIAHDGRVILTACDPHQEAIEDPSYGHGLLTWFLMEGLKGAPEVIRNGRIPIYPLLQYVTQRVVDEAASVGHDQRPTMRGTIDGALTIPILVPGPLMASRFPERNAPPVSSNVEDLAALAIPEFIIEIWRQAIPGLNDLQRRAINEFGVLAGRNIVVSAPTSSGKTMIGELAAVRGFADRKRSLFLLPLKALVADKFDEFKTKYGEQGVRIIRATGEINDDIPTLLLGRYDICLMTYEKAAALLLAHPHVLRGVGTIVIDEAQMLTDASRGANLEFLLTMLKYKRAEGVRPQLILLSAVIGATNGLERWISAGLLRSDVRPVPLREGVLRANGQFRYVDADGNEHTESYVQRQYAKGSAQDLLIPLAKKLAAADENVIVFRVKKSETQHVAVYLARALQLPAAAETVDALPATDLSAASLRLRECLQHGVAFHNADLGRDERRVVERSFRQRDGIRIVVATTTIAMGVNTPASTVVIVGLEHPGGDPYTVAEYKNMVGRAGRLGFSETGKSMVICLSPAEEHIVWTRYIKGQPEALSSRLLASDPLTLITRVLATADKAKVPEMTEEQVVGFIQSSFGAFQQAQRPGARPITKAVLGSAFARLVASNLIQREGDGYRLTDLGRLAGEGGVAVESIIRLVDALRGVSCATLDDGALLTAAQLTLELDDVFFPIHKKSTQERDRWRRFVREEGVPHQIQSAVLQGEHATARAKRAAAVLLWTRGIEIRDIEASLLQHMPDTDAAGAVRAVADRTRDLVPTVTRVAEILSTTGDADFAAIVDRLLVQLELGIPAAIVPLARFARTRLTRGDYLSLVRRGLVSGATLANTSDADLLEAVPPTTLAVLRDVQGKLAS